MSKHTHTFKSFADLSRHVRKTERASDIDAAKRLRQTPHMRKPGTLAVAKRK